MPKEVKERKYTIKESDTFIERNRNSWKYCGSNMCNLPLHDIKRLPNYIGYNIGGSNGLLCHLMANNKEHRRDILHIFPPPNDIEIDVYFYSTSKNSAIQKSINQMMTGNVTDSSPPASRTNYLDYEGDRYIMNVSTRYHYTSSSNKYCSYNIIYINPIMDVNTGKLIEFDKEIYESLLRKEWLNILIFRSHTASAERTGKKLINDYVRWLIVQKYYPNNSLLIRYFNYAKTRDELKIAKQTLNRQNSPITYNFSVRSKRRSIKSMYIKRSPKKKSVRRRSSKRKSRRKSVRRRSSKRKSRRKSVRRRSSKRKSRRKSVRRRSSKRK
jgi:hypothetical protein